jgi:hypothetical protein
LEGGVDKEKLRKIRIYEEKLRELGNYIKELEACLDSDQKQLDKHHHDKESAERLNDSIMDVENKLDGLYYEQTEIEGVIESLRQVEE